VGVELRGMRMGLGRQPLSEKHQAALLELRTTVGKLLAEAGLSGESAGSTAGTGPLGPQEISRIVASVLRALQAQGVSVTN
jgi:hypothetical protein